MQSPEKKVLTKKEKEQFEKDKHRKEMYIFKAQENKYGLNKVITNVKDFP